MKNILLNLFLVTTCTFIPTTIFAQTAYIAKDILHSSDIPEIENFIKNANPNDNRIQILQSKLVSLKEIQKQKTDETQKKNQKEKTESEANTNLYAANNKDIKTQSLKEKEEVEKPAKRAKKRKGSIMESTDIDEINEYIKTLHPDDIRIYVLKNKVIALKNAEMTRRAREAKPMAARPIENNTNTNKAFLPVQNYTNPIDPEAEEFKKLYAETPKEQTDKTVALLNKLFDQDINSTDVMILIENKSKCNIIVRFNGNKNYNLAIPSENKNSIVIEKGSYNLTSNVCNAKYSSSKNLNKNMSITIKKSNTKN